MCRDQIFEFGFLVDSFFNYGIGQLSQRYKSIESVCGRRFPVTTYVRYHDTHDRALYLIAKKTGMVLKNVLNAEYGRMPNAILHATIIR
jgi:hypothetical protein